VRPAEQRLRLRWFRRLGSRCRPHCRFRSEKRLGPALRLSQQVVLPPRLRRQELVSLSW